MEYNKGVLWDGESHPFLTNTKFPKIAKYYGVPLKNIMKDNQVMDALVVANNTIFIRNPQTNVPYSPAPLTDQDKMRIDGALMGRGCHGIVDLMIPWHPLLEGKLDL